MKAVLYRTVWVRPMIVCLLFVFSACIFAGCGGDESSDGGTRTTQSSFISPSADGTEVQEEGNVRIDSSNTDEGYVMVTYLGEADMSRVQITYPSGTIYS